MSAIFKREFKSYFTTPLGYVYVAIFLFFESFFFVNLFANGAPNIEIIFPTISFITILITPVLTMRLLSEDRRQKVDQALLTAPVSIFGIVMGKFLAAFAVFGLGYAPTLVYQMVFTLMGTPNWLIYLNGLVGTLLIGSALVAIGMFISSLTESPVISCILTLVIFMLLQVVPNLASLTGYEWLITIANKIAFINLFSSFSGSVFRIVDVIYLASITFIFVFLSIRTVERRRWA